MDFEKKIKMRLYIAISYCVIGVILITFAFLCNSENYENYFISSFGFTLLLMGILRILKNRNITKNKQAMHRQEVTESDERNRMLAERARSWAFSFSIMIAGIVVIVLSVMGRHEQALPFSWFVCVMVALYWIFWLIARKKY